MTNEVKSPQAGAHISKNFNHSHKKFTNKFSNYFNEILTRLDGVKQTGHNQFTALCPAHDDRNPSLSVALKDGKVLLHCFKGCSYQKIIQALGLNRSDIHRLANSNSHYSASSDNSSDKIQLRLIADDTKRRFVFKDPSTLDLHEPTKHDLKQIHQKLGKRWCLETLQALGIKICKAPYALALWDTKQLEFDYGSSTCYYVEGRTDLITLYDEINIDKSSDTPTLDAKYSIASRYNVAAPITLLDSAKEHIFLLDADDDPARVAKQITNLKPGLKIKFVHLDGSKDVSDFFYKDGKDIFGLQRLITKAKYYEVRETTTEPPPSGNKQQRDDATIKAKLHELNYRMLDDFAVRIQNNVLNHVDLKDINRLITNARTEWELQTISERNEIIKDSNVKNFLQDIDPSVSILRDTATEAYFAFADFVLQITKHGIKRIDYKNLDKYVWKDKIIRQPFDFDLIWDKLCAQSSEHRDFRSENPNFIPFYNKQAIHDLILHDKSSLFAKFLQDTCTNPETNVVEPEKLELLMRVIGYCVHQHKNPAFAKAVVLTDLNFMDTASGGTGKSLIATAISYVRKTIDVEYVNDTQFQFDNYEPDCDLIVMDELPQYFKIKSFYKHITNDFTLRRKFRSQLVIPFEKSPKIIFISNHLPVDFSDSTIRRLIVFQLYRYYSARWAPYQKYGKYLFTDFDRAEWTMFFLTMAFCVHLFVAGGMAINEKEFEAVAQRALAINLDPELRQIFDELPRNEFISNTEFRKRLCGTKYEGSQNLKEVERELAQYCQIKFLEIETRKKNGERGRVLKEICVDR